MPTSNSYHDGFTIDSAAPRASSRPDEGALAASCARGFVKLFEAFALLSLGIVFLFPFFWMVSTSLKTLAETLEFPPALLPHVFMWENFLTAWNSSNFPAAGLNSLVVAVGVIVLQLAVILPAAYAFAFKRFRFSRFFFTLVIAGLMIPPQVTFLPLYLLFSKLRLINTYIPLIFPFVSSAFGIFLLTQSFRQVPVEVVESARLDGASEWKIIRRVLLPAVVPTVVTFVLFSFISHWNDYFWVLSMTNDESVRTLPLAVVRLIDSDGGVKHWHTTMAANMILVAPILLVYIPANRWIKRAFAYNGIK